MDLVIRKMREVCSVSDKSVAELLRCVEPCRFSKRHRLVCAGERCRYAYFIEKGMTRSFWLVDGEEITTSFTVEGAVVFSMDELYYDKMSEEYVEALEDL